jgi:AcrR family transcriptional regulator
MTRLHPTKELLLMTVVKLLDAKTPEELNSDEVLEISAVSKGSLYHHYQDFPELIEEALVFRFGQFVDRSVSMLTAAITSSRSRQQLIDQVKEVTKLTQSEALKANRFERVGAIDKAIRQERMARKLGEEQERLTHALADLFRESVAKGFGDPALDPRAVSIMVQAYTLGKVVDDFTPNHVDPEKWTALIDLILEKVFFTRG